ncbi:MAG: hypothetical protein O2999_03715 [Nitrospirae bacterium]|nr:hypothetical protein [Nitrospirota bacterium]
MFRWVITPDHNLAEDPFELIEAGKHLLLTGEYRVPGVGASDMVLRHRIPSWPVGFPLALAGVFSVFGAEEGIARLFTIASSSLLAPLSAGIAYLAQGNTSVAIGAGLLASIHPLAVAFGGQVFTNNLSVTLFFIGLFFLMSSLVKKAGEPIVAYPDVRREPRRLSQFSIAFLAFGLMLTVRDTDVMLALPVFYLGWKAKFFDPLLNFQTVSWKPWGTLLLFAVCALAIGWSPSLYFNMINFGSPLVSTHYQTGIRLSMDYMFRGGEALMGMPGIVVMFLAFLVYHFPFFAMLLVARSYWVSIAPICVMGLLVMIPVVLIAGAFPVAATGAAPRYVLPLIPFTAILSSCVIPLVWRKTRRLFSVAFIGTVIMWQIVMTYPPSELFSAWPRFGYLAYYSPAYVMRSYRNYPDHTNAMVRWVREQTPADAVIITQSRPHHFFYYGKRDVIVVDEVKPEQWKVLATKRPVFLVEDNNLAVQPEQVDLLKHSLRELDVRLETVGSVPTFSPKRGNTTMHAYRVIPVS